MKLGTVEVPDCTSPPYAHWWEIGAWQTGITLAVLVLIVGLTICFVTWQEERKK